MTTETIFFDEKNILRFTPEYIECPYCGKTHEKDIGHLYQFEMSSGTILETCWDMYIEWIARSIPSRWIAKE